MSGLLLESKRNCLFKGNFANGKGGIHLTWENNQPLKSHEFKNGVLNGKSWELSKCAKEVEENILKAKKKENGFIGRRMWREK